MENPIELETEELRRFREEWRQEVVGRREHESSSSAAPPAPSSAIGAITTSNVFEANSRPQIWPTGPRASAALELYSQAVKLETEGQLDAATALYRRAFRLQEDVDKVYYRLTLVPELKLRDLSRDVDALSLAQRSPLLKVPASAKITSHSLRHILASFPIPEEISFERDVEIQPFVLDRLPDELLIHILQCFVHTADTRSVERFAAVSRKARIVTLDSALWRDFVELIYVPPQLHHSPHVLLPFYQYDYRNFYMHQPRVRLDGVYIAACHYLRRGHSENAWVNITHMITYYRYLRFLPNGVVISLLSSDATASPQQIIPYLKLGTPLTRGMHVGQWTLERPLDDGSKKLKSDEEYEEEGPVVVVDGLLDVAPGGPAQSGSHAASAAAASATPKYSFRMQLGLRSKPTGRWNKLDILRYESVHLATDEATPLPLKHERPYWFSKVRSYGSGMH